MRHDTLSDALVTIKNADHVGKDSANVPASRLIGDVLKLLTEKGYLKNYEFKDNGQGGEFAISLNGRINGCGAIKPRFSVKIRDMERHEARYLPAKDFGIQNYDYYYHNYFYLKSYSYMPSLIYFLF